MVQRSITRPPSPYPVVLTSDHTRSSNTAESTVYDSDNLWDTITPSAFLSISSFIPPREQTPEPPIKDAEYLSILNWDQPIPSSQYARVSFDESTVLAPYSQEPTPEPEPIAGPSRPTW